MNGAICDESVWAARHEPLAKARVDSLRGDMSQGQLALEALEIYHGFRLPAPDWALRAVRSCYQEFKEGRPAAMRTDSTGPAALTLGQAFGVRDHRGTKVFAGAKRRAIALARPLVAQLFSGEQKLARTKDGRELAAERINEHLQLSIRITEDDIDKILEASSRQKSA